MSKESGAPRLFVALPLPPAVTRVLCAIQPRAEKGVRPIGEDEMHLTLHFLGSKAVAPVRRALARVSCAAFRLRLGRPGRFSPPGRKAILWVGVEPSSELLALHGATQKALEDLGFEPESRPYRPHITLARIAAGATAGLVDAFEAVEPNPAGLEFECTRFALYESETRPDGARYRILESFPLSLRA